MEKIINVRLPFDRRHEDDSKNYGIHGLDIWFILKGERGAVQFAVTFPVFLPHVAAELKWKDKPYLDGQKIRGFDVGYHAKAPQYEGQIAMDNCDICNPCYYDGSSLASDRWVEEIFSIRGEAPEKRLWEKLEQEYISRFGELK